LLERRLPFIARESVGGLFKNTLNKNSQ